MNTLSFYAANKVTTGTVGGTTFTVEEDVVADTYQASINFTEAGTFTLTGQFRTTTTETPVGTDPPVIKIVVLDESGT